MCGRKLQRSGRECRRRRGAHRDSDGFQHAYATADRLADARRHGVAGPDADRNSDRYADCDTAPDRYADADRYAGTDRDADADPGADGHADAGYPSRKSDLTFLYEYRRSICPDVHGERSAVQRHA